MPALSITSQARDSLAETAVRREGKRLLNFIRRRVRTEEDAEDILQEVLFQLVASYSVTEPIEKLTSWLFGVARNKIVDWYRKRRVESVPIDDAGLLSSEHVLLDPNQVPDDLFDRALVWSELEESLEELPEEQRDVFIMHEVEGRSFREIAELTGEPINTLLSRKRYAVLHLREKLWELYDELEHF